MTDPRFVTEATSQREEAPPAERALREVGPLLATEFNNILMGIQSFVEVIQRRMADDTGVGKATVEIANAIRRGKELSSQILRFSQRSVLQSAPVDLGELARSLRPELQNAAGKVHLDIPKEFEEMPIRADVDQLRHVLMDLVLNAAEASSPGGKVAVSVERVSADQAAAAGSHLSNAAEYALVTIRDSGSGISPEALSQVFSPLFTTKRRHLGLGLALARQIIWDHGGDIFLKRIPTGGTAVYVVLPISARAAATAEPRVLRKIVLVEDDAVVASGIAALFELEGVTVTHVDSGGAAIRAIEKTKPDALVLDLGLPDMPGIDVYREVAKRWPQLPVVFSTGDADESRLDAYTGKPHVLFLAKPYDVDTLLENLRRAIAAS